jgi:hypothetical protein
MFCSVHVFGKQAFRLSTQHACRTLLKKKKKKFLGSLILVAELSEEWQYLFSCPTFATNACHFK